MGIIMRRKKHFISILALLFLSPIIGQDFCYNPLSKVPQRETQINNNTKAIYQEYKKDLHGAYLLLENDSVKECGKYVKNKAHATWKSYSDNGNLRAEVNYIKGKKHGQWTVYHENGEVMFSYQYNKGKATGKWKQYSETGELLALRIL